MTYATIYLITLLLVTISTAPAIAIFGYQLIKHDCEAFEPKSFDYYSTKLEGYLFYIISIGLIGYWVYNLIIFQ